MMLAVRTVVLAALVFALSGATASAAIISFRTPSKNIACAFQTRPAFLRCDILSGLKPEPSRRCAGDWTGVSMRRFGKAAATCAGDTVYERRAPVLAYGRVWTRGGFRCLSRPTGLTCSNGSRHGFFLSRERWRVF